MTNIPNEQPSPADDMPQWWCDCMQAFARSVDLPPLTETQQAVAADHVGWILLTSKLRRGARYDESDDGA